MQHPNMAACSLFEEDVVCHVTPDNTFVYGLVMENSETVSSDEDDPPEDICNRGCVRVAWHPRGKESYNTPENKVLLVDRSLMVADVVRRFVPGQETQCGTVQDLQVTCHLHITGTDKYIYNVDSKLLSPCIQMQKYENGYVTMDNWLGRVEEVVENIVLRLPDGARCELKDSDAAYLDDISEKRPETVTFNEEFWYPGQQLKGDVCNLYNATWLNSTLLYNSKNNNKRDTFYAVVESVKICYISVYWICCGYSKASIAASSQTMPPLRVEGDDLERLHLVDSFEHCAVKLGDKMYYTIREEDVLETQQPKHRFVPHAALKLAPQRLTEITHRTEDLYLQRFEETGKPRHRGSKRGAAVYASSSNATATTVTPSMSASSVPDGAVGESNTMETEDAPKEKKESAEQNHAASGQAAMGKGAGDLEVDIDADDEYEDIDDAKEEEDSDDGSLSSSASGPKRRKRDRGIGVPIKTLRRASRQARRTRPVMEISVKPGSQVATEVCYTFSMATVLWQDGSVEQNIPSVELYPMHHLDELEYFPGAFVVDSKGNDYGVITSCNRFERTCQIKWFQPYEVGSGNCPTEVIKDSEMSVYDIQDHPEFKFRPGSSVIRVSGFEDMEQTLQAVGQVVRVDTSGTVFVYWSDGTYTSSYPQDLYIVWDMSDYSNSSSEVDSTDSEEYDSSEGNSSASWETEEEEWKIDGASGDGSQSEGDENDKHEGEGNLKFKDMDKVGSSEISDLVSKIRSCFEVVTVNYEALTSKTPEAIQYMSSLNPDIISSLKEVLKMYRSFSKLEKEMKMDKNSCETTPITGFITAIKYGMKREKSNKIKQHLAHVFESTNKGLLDQSKEEKRVKEATDTPDRHVSGESATVETIRPPQVSPTISGPVVKKVKTRDVGTAVDVELGSPVDVSRNTACDMVENGILSKVQENVENGSLSTVQENVENGSLATVQDVERDISSRLAATNVDEHKDEGMGENEVQDHCGLATAAPAEEQAQADVKPELDEAQVQEFLQTVNKNMQSVQEYILTLQGMLTGDKKHDAKPRGKASEEEEEKEKPETQANSDAHPLIENEKEGETEMEVLAGTGAEARSDNLEACENASGSSINGKPSETSSGIADDEEEIVDPPGVVLPQGFFMCSTAPSCHGYGSKTCMPSNPKKFQATLKKELKLLRSSLPHGIIVKGFEDRMDLFSVLIDGPSDTPYEDGMFLFDVMLPHDYPLSPPLFHYLSFASDRLNPNLYVDGKVCVSLLGTWSGKGMEVWTDQSNLLQVLVSIQGLILVDEPYYNEAGYERQRGHQIALENSRMYNEMALLRLVESLTTLCDRLPEPFEQEVRERLKTNGYRMIARLRKWVSMSEKMGDRQSLVTSSNVEKGAEGGADTETHKESSLPPCDSAASGGTASASEAACLSESANGTSEAKQSSEPLPPGHPHFPLLPMSKGFRLTLQKSLTQFETALNALQALGEPEGASECGQASCEQSDGVPS